MTNTTAHTPGPWVVNGLNVWGPLDARSKHHNGRTLIGGVVDDMNDWRSHPSVSPDDRAEFRTERDANLSLIAAAPELLAALEAIIEEPVSNFIDVERMKGLARAAIAKAKGNKF